MGLPYKQMQTVSYYYLHRKLLLFARMMLEHDISYQNSVNAYSSAYEYILYKKLKFHYLN